MIAARFVFRGEDPLALLPVTSKAPKQDVAAFELPALEVSRLQRGTPGRLWVVLSEMNVDRAHGSFYLRPDCKRGDLSRADFRALYHAFLEHVDRAAKVRRLE